MTGASPVAHRLRLPAPARDDLVRWPEEFGTRFTITVDVEEAFDWSAPFSRASRSVGSIAALSPMHRRFAAAGIGIAYLVDHPIASDPAAVALLRKLLTDGRSEIGTQLHPWVNPPHLEEPSDLASFAGNLPIALEAAKLDALTGAIAEAFGRPPRAFRAGRYGLGPHTFALLAERGYQVDSSMRAYHDYSPIGGPDFREIGNAAFRAGPGGAILELPLTSVFTGRARRWGASLHPVLGRLPKGRGIAARLRLLSRAPLTPEGTPVAEALEAVRVALDDGLRLLNLSFHSPSLVPGNTPYVRDEADLSRFHAWWDAVLDLLAARGVRPATLDQIIRAAAPHPAVAPPRASPLGRERAGTGL